MKICMVSEYFPPRIVGGGEYSAYLYARGLARQGHEVHVLTSHPRHSVSLVSDSKNILIHEKKDGIYIHRILGVKTLRWRQFDLSGLCANEFFFLHALFTIISFVTREKPDIIHALNIQSIPPSVMAAKICKIPIVVTYNSYGRICLKGDRLKPDKSVCEEPASATACFSCMDYYTKSSRYRQGWLSRSNFLFPFLFLREFLICSVFRICLKMVDKIIAISNSVRNVLVKTGIPADRIEVIPVIVDLETFRTTRNMMAIRKEDGFSAKDKIILFVGAVFDSRKGSDFLIDAMPKVLRVVPHAKFLIVGEVPSRELALIGNRNLKEYVCFMGYIPSKRLPDIYTAADVVVIPSLWPEPFGRVLIEAMIVKKPVVASRVGGITDIIQNEVNGLLVKPKDVGELAEAIIRILKEGELAEKMGEAGKKTVERKFSEKTVTYKIVDVYKVILGSNRELVGNS